MKRPATISKSKAKPDRDAESARYLKELGAALASLREGTQMSQQAFADEIGIDQTTVAKAERGHHFWRIETWLRLQKVLGVPFEAILTHTANASRSGSGMDKTIAALGPEERELVRLFENSNKEGRAIIMEKAKAARSLYPRNQKVVDLAPKRSNQN